VIFGSQVFFFGNRGRTVRLNQYSRLEGDRIEYEKTGGRHHYATPPTAVA
jgi:hypothetical protein